MQIVKAMGDTVITVKDFISWMVTMMVPDGQVIYGYNCCVLVGSRLVSFSVTVFIVFNVFVVFLVMSSCDPFVIIYFSSKWYNIHDNFANLGYWFISCLGVLAGTRAKENNISLLHYAIHSSHYSGITWAWWRLKSPTTRLFVHASICLTNKKVNVKTPHYRPFLRIFNGKHWFSVTKGRWSW